MKAVLFDIETVGMDFSGLDKCSQDYFLRFAESHEEIENIKSGLSFYPLTAQIAAIGMLDAERDEGAVYYQDRGENAQKSAAEGIAYVPATEAQILKLFWKQIMRYDRFITFNGRVFDCPFIMLRSAILGIQCAKNLVPYRYSSQVHVDLADQLSFYDALRRRFNLHMWCQAFGIPSPKSGAMNGHDIARKFKDGDFKEIAEYCMRDVRATKKLYQYWRQHLTF